MSNGIASKSWVIDLLKKVLKKGGASSKYSTEETKVGTWIDGKPIYRKVIKCNNATIRDDWVDGADISDLNIDYVVSASGTGLCKQGWRTTVGSSYLGVNITTTKISVASMSGTNPITDINVILEYTKTTD